MYIEYTEYTLKNHTRTGLSSGNAPLNVACIRGVVVEVSFLAPNVRPSLVVGAPQTLCAPGTLNLGGMEAVRFFKRK